MEEKKYRSPNKDTDFSKYWGIFISQVEKRDNFNVAHLEQLKILCTLYIDYDVLTKKIEEEGMTYESSGRYGHSIRENPSFSMRAKTLSEIRHFTKLLGVVLNKGVGSTPLPAEKDDEWDI